MVNAKNLLLLALLLSACSKEEITPVVNTSKPTQPEVKYVLKVEASAGGKVDISEGTYPKGTEVTIRATPNNFFDFSGWSNGKSENPLKIVMDKDISLKAEFVKQDLNLAFSYTEFSEPVLPPSPEGLAYIKINDVPHLIIPFADLKTTKVDYLRIFQFDEKAKKIVDKTKSIFKTISEVGYPKSPLIVKDFNKDGFLDLFLVDHGQENSMINGRWEGGYLLMYYGSANGFIKQNFPGITDKKLFYHHADVGDYDNDGDLDIISQRWSSASERVPADNTVAILKNNQGKFEIITLEKPLDSVGSVLFTNLDDDPFLEVMCATYRNDQGSLWAWDPMANTTNVINNKMGPYEIHDLVEISNAKGKRILIFPEDYQGKKTPILTTSDNGKTISSSTDMFDFQGRDVIVNDFNGDGLADIFTYYGNDGEWTSSSYGPLTKSIYLNTGNNTFANPQEVKDIFGKDFTSFIGKLFYPLESTPEGYKFLRFEEFWPSPFPKAAEIVILKMK